jgi:hypothetical protein
VQFSSTFFQEVSNREKSKNCGFFFDCIEQQALEMSRRVSFTMDLQCKMEKQKEFTEIELAADTDSVAYEEDNVAEAELQEEQKNASVGGKSNWGLQQHAGSSRERGLRKNEALTIDKDSSPLSIVMLCFIAVIPVLGKRPLLVRS